MVQVFGVIGRGLKVDLLFTTLSVNRFTAYGSE